MTIQIAHQKKKKKCSLESQIVLSLPPSAICFPGEAPAQLAACGSGPSQMGMEGSPQEQAWQVRLQEHSLEQAAEGCLRFHFQWNIWLLCQSIAHAVGLGEQGISQTSQKSYTNFPLS